VKEALLLQARARNANYRQYDRQLRDENCSVRVATKRKSCRGRLWFDKGEAVLVLGKPEWLTYIGKPQFYLRIWSINEDSFCLAEESAFAKE
jgi:hypothetical protein